MVSAYTKTKLPLKMPAPPLTGLKQALVAMEWGNERSGNNWETKTKTFASLAGDESTGGAMVHSLRSLGSAALNWYVQFGVNISCLLADLGHIPYFYPHFGGFPLLCTKIGPQDNLLKQTPAPAPEPVS